MKYWTNEQYAGSVVAASESDLLSNEQIKHVPKPDPETALDASSAPIRRFVAIFS